MIQCMMAWGKQDTASNRGTQARSTDSPVLEPMEKKLEVELPRNAFRIR